MPFAYEFAHLVSTPVGWRGFNRSGCLANLAVHPRGGTVSAVKEGSPKPQPPQNSSEAWPRVCERQSGPCVPARGGTRGGPCLHPVLPQPVSFCPARDTQTAPRAPRPAGAGSLPELLLNCSAEPQLLSCGLSCPLCAGSPGGWLGVSARCSPASDQRCRVSLATRGPWCWLLTLGRNKN